MDVVKLAKDILEAALVAPVSTEVPSDRPDRMVNISLDSMQSDGFLLTPRLMLICWGASDRDAFGLAMSAVDALREAALDHDYLSAVDLESVAREEWSRTGQSRYMALVTLYVNTDEE